MAPILLCKMYGEISPYNLYGAHTICMGRFLGGFFQSLDLALEIDVISEKILDGVEINRKHHDLKAFPWLV